VGRAMSELKRTNAVELGGHRSRIKGFLLPENRPYRVVLQFCEFSFHSAVLLQKTFHEPGSCRARNALTFSVYHVARRFELNYVWS